MPPKVRKTWTRNPKTQVQPNKKRYNRTKQKRELDKIKREEV